MEEKELTSLSLFEKFYILEPILHSQNAETICKKLLMDG